MTTAWQSPVDAWLDELRDEEARLTRELALCRRILAATEGGGEPAGTDALVRSLAARVPSTTWSASWMTVQLRDAGWTTTSCDPENAVRSALSRGVDAGWLTRPARGVYRYAGTGEET